MSLGISINEQDLFPLVRQCSSKIDTRRRLSAAALSVADGNYPTQMNHSSPITDSTFHANPSRKVETRASYSGRTRLVLQKCFNTATLMKQLCYIIASSGTVQAMQFGNDARGTYLAMYQ